MASRDENAQLMQLGQAVDEFVPRKTLGQPVEHTGRGNRSRFKSIDYGRSHRIEPDDRGRGNQVQELLVRSAEPLGFGKLISAYGSTSSCRHLEYSGTVTIRWALPRIGASVPAPP